MDWTLDPRFRPLLKHLPLPLRLPTVLRRGDGPTSGRELADSRAAIVRVRDPLDVALARILGNAGAALTVTDPRPDGASLLALHDLAPGHVPAGLDPAIGIGDAIRQGGAPGDRRAVTLVARLGAESLDGDAGTDTLYAIGKAAATLPPNGRVLIVIGQELTTPQGHLLAATAAGLARALVKELGPRATTVHVLRQSGASDAGVAAVARFLASPRAAFLTGLDLRLCREIDDGGGSGLNGKVTLVTGGARGIGAAIGERLAQEGARVWLNDLPNAADKAAAVIERIRAAGGVADFAGGDLATDGGCVAVAEAIQARDGHLDVAVHNAGITRDRTIKNLRVEDWRLVLQVDFHALRRLQGRLDPLMRAGGSLVLMSSVMGIAGNFGQTNYCAAKSGVIELAKQWSCHGATRGVRANAIAPGFIQTEMTAAVPVLNREMARQMTALLQPGLPSDVAELATFLASPAAAAVTGLVLRCDGGMALGA
jgi:3-oxoacyl-[acyl-carrier protein] reductase